MILTKDQVGGIVALLAQVRGRGLHDVTRCAIPPRWRSRFRGRQAKATCSGWHIATSIRAGERLGSSAGPQRAHAPPRLRDELEFEVGPTSSEDRAISRAGEGAS